MEKKPSAHHISVHHFCLATYRELMPSSLQIYGCKGKFRMADIDENSFAMPQNAESMVCAIVWHCWHFGCSFLFRATFVPNRIIPIAIDFQSPRTLIGFGMPVNQRLIAWFTSVKLYLLYWYYASMESSQSIICAAANQYCVKPRNQMRSPLKAGRVFREMKGERVGGGVVEKGTNAS